MVVQSETGLAEQKDTLHIKAVILASLFRMLTGYLCHRQSGKLDKSTAYNGSYVILTTNKWVAFVFQTMFVQLDDKWDSVAGLNEQNRNLFLPP